MDTEVDGRVQSLPYKIRSISRESPAQKAANVLDPDLRTYWSTSTNTKEWLVLELEESCLLSHIRIHNKSVLEWEISIGLRFKPDTYLKVRSRCEAPRRDVTYNVGYQPCCFVRISCLRGNPVGIFFIQLMGIPIPGLEPELQPVVDYVLPHVIAHIRDPHDIYIQLLQDIASRLPPFLQQLEGDLAVGAEAMESSVRFFAMLVGPYYPILMILNGRENEKALASGSDRESSKSSQATVFTVSSNFQAPPKRARSPGLSQQPAGIGLAFRIESVFLLLRASFKDNSLGSLCRKIGRILGKLYMVSSGADHLQSGGDSLSTSGISVPGTGSEEEAGGSAAVASQALAFDYSSIFGEDYRSFDDDGIEITQPGILDVAAVEEGLLHVLYACVSQPTISRRLADSKADLVPVLPLVQAMLPALRPPPSISADADNADETFWQWQTAPLQRAVKQVVALSASPSYRPLLDACAGYLASYSPTHEKAACVLIDLCGGPLAAWIPIVVAKIDLTMEILEGLLGTMQAENGGRTSGRVTVVYLMLALSGHVDGVLAQFKEVKHRVLFLIEILEPFLVPAITRSKSTIAFGDVSAVLDVKQEQTSALALDLLRAAIQKPAVLPSLESEWRRGHVTPGVLLSILAPHVPQPPGISFLERRVDKNSVPGSMTSTEDAVRSAKSDLMSKASDEGVIIAKADTGIDGSTKNDIVEDPSLLFAPVDLRSWTLPAVTKQFESTPADPQLFPGTVGHKGDGKASESKNPRNIILDIENADEHFNLQADYLQLVNSQERELRALEFTRFANELRSRKGDGAEENHQAATDALLLAAECHLNPFFMMPASEYQQLVSRLGLESRLGSFNVERADKQGTSKEHLGSLLRLEEDRDKAVLHILLEAAKWDRDIENIRGTGADNIVGAFDGIQIFAEDSGSEDALTLIRQHQSLLCEFLIRQLQRETQNMYEVLLQGLVLILDSATEISVPPVSVVEVILQCAERLNRALTAHYSSIKSESGAPESPVLHEIRRQWALLCKLVLVASGERQSMLTYNSEIQEGGPLQMTLIPVQAWMAKILEFPFSGLPLVRYVGWMALSRCAKYYAGTGFLLVSDVEQLRSLLLIFSDELYSVEVWKPRMKDDLLSDAAYRVAMSGTDVIVTSKSDGDQDGGHFDPGGLIRALYPELDLVYPKFRSQFSQIAETILESVCQVLKALPSSSIPDLLSWFSEICTNPFPTPVKGFAVANVKYVILNLLQVIVVEHTVAVVPELPRVVSILLSLCFSAYSDVDLLESVLAILKPIITHATATEASLEELAHANNPGVSFEALCFDSLLEQLKIGPGSSLHLGDAGGEPKSALLLFLAGSILSDLSASKRNELMESLMQWANFVSANPKNMYYNYLRAFQKILEECNVLLERLAGDLSEDGDVARLPIRKVATQALFALTAPLDYPLPPAVNGGYPQGLEIPSEADDSDGEHSTVEDEGAAGSVEKQEDRASELLMEPLHHNDQGSFDGGGSGSPNSELKLDSVEVTINSKDFQSRCAFLVMAVSPSLESCWKIHPQLALLVSRLAAKCLHFSGFRGRTSNEPESHNAKGMPSWEVTIQNLDVNAPSASPLEVLAGRILELQEGRCWQVAAVIMDYLLSLMGSSLSSQALMGICAVLHYQCRHAPRVAWRLQTNKWLLRALSLTAVDVLRSTSTPLIGLLSVMLDHPEPEQRFAALQQLGNLTKEDQDLCPESDSDGVLANTNATPYFDEVACALVASTWEKVANTAATDPLLGLRKEAMELLLKFVPLAQPLQLQSYLQSSETVIQNLTSSEHATCTGPLTRLALLVLSRCCLFASEQDFRLIPERVWDALRVMANSKTGGVFAQPERALCQALLQLREFGDAAKEPVKRLLSGNTDEQPRHDIIPLREAILQVLVRLSVVRSKEDSKASADLEVSRDLEEAELEYELLVEDKSKRGGEEAGGVHYQAAVPNFVVDAKLDTTERLKQLKRQTLEEDRANLKAAIAVRQERKRKAQRDRQLELEAAAVRHVEHLQEWDREKAAEAEREIERQRILERERAKTREMRLAMELENEKRSQREYQRDLEQRDSGSVRSARRAEFSTATTPSSNRPRERYRERDRETGRPTQEGSARSSTGGNGSRENLATPPATPTAASVPAATPAAAGEGGRGGGLSVAGSGSVVTGPTGRSIASGYVQSARDRDERSGHDDSGTENSGVTRSESVDGSNFGDGDTGGVASFEGGAGGGLSGQKQGGPKTTRLRQIVERRDRDGRREGKWERKQT